MRTLSIGFLTGIMIFQYFSDLPPKFVLWIMPLAILAGLFWPRWCWWWGCLLGFGYVLLHAHSTFNHALDSQLIAQDSIISGRVVSLPERNKAMVSFDFYVDELLFAEKHWRSPGRVRLNWYQADKTIQYGDSLRMAVRLKPPVGHLNPGGMDYDGWLFYKKISALGTVKTLLSQAAMAPTGQFSPLTDGYDWVQFQREKLAQAVVRQNYTHGALINALSIGDRRAMNERQWEVYRDTGTSHLIAISGFHISIIALVIFVVVRRVWASIPNAALYLAAPKVAAWTAFSGALVYSLFAGFSIPTQRTLIMIAVGLVALLRYRYYPPSLVLAIALLLVLLWDPFAVMDPGFWLSFGAVAILFFMLIGRAHGPAWRQWMSAQVLISLALVPLLLIFFGQISLVSPVANGFAVPWVSFIILPLLFAGLMVFFLNPAWAMVIFQAADWSFELLWQVLQFFADLPWSQWIQHQPAAWAAVAGCVGIVLFLSPRGLPGRYLSVIYLLPLFFNFPPKPGLGEVWVTVLDVGHGLAVVVETAQHSLVYDTGPAFGESDAGQRTLIPFLRQRGIRQLDTLVISHNDRDHRGGALSLLKEFPSKEFYASELDQWMPSNRQNCTLGQQWQWDEVNFFMLHPSPEDGMSENDESCVLAIRVGQQQILLTGDIEQKAEQILVQRWQNQLKSTVIIAPHHGSRTSSSPEFLDQVKPNYVIYSVNHGNRFGFPHEIIRKNYQLRAVAPFYTYHSGAITVKLNRHNDHSVIEEYRVINKRYWHFKLGNVE